MVYYSAITRNKYLIYMMTWINLQGIMLSRKKKSYIDTYCIVPFIIYSFLNSFLMYFIDYTITGVPCFLLFIPLHLVTPLPPSFPHLSSCPWVIHISSWASPFHTLFLTIPCLLTTYHIGFLFPVLPPPFSSSLSLLITLHVISISVNLFLFYLFT